MNQKKQSNHSSQRVETRGLRERPSSVVTEEDAMVKRILDMRRKDCELLDRAVLSKIVREKWQQLNPLSKETDEREQFVILLQQCFQRAADEALPVSKRRTALDSIKILLEELESNIAAAKNNRRDDEEEEEEERSRKTSGVSPLHSPLEEISQPTAKRPNAVHQLKAKRSPVNAVRNDPVPSQSNVPDWSGSPQPNLAATSAASFPSAPQLGWPTSNSTRASVEASVFNKPSTLNPKVPEKCVNSVEKSISDPATFTQNIDDSSSLSPSTTTEVPKTDSQSLPLSKKVVSAGTSITSPSTFERSNGNLPVVASAPLATTRIGWPAPSQTSVSHQAPSLSNGSVHGLASTIHSKASAPPARSIPQTSQVPNSLNGSAHQRHTSVNTPTSISDAPAPPSPSVPQTSVSHQAPNFSNGAAAISNARAPPSQSVHGTFSARANPTQPSTTPVPPTRGPTPSPSVPQTSLSHQAPNLSNGAAQHRHTSVNTPAAISNAPAPPSQSVHETSSARANPTQPSTTPILPTRGPTEKSVLQQYMEFSETPAIPNVQTIHFPPDLGIPVGTKLKTRSGLLETRINNLQVTCRPKPITSAMAQDTDRRIREWDPYRKPLAYVSMGLTSTVVSCQPAGNFARTAFSAQVDLTKPKLKVAGKFATALANYPGIKWGTKSESGLELVLMMFPLNRTDKDRNKRADGHLWPKGSFLVVQNFPQELQQRRQESHDRSLWKGSSEPLDLVTLIKDPKRPVKIDLCSYDDDVYLYCVMLCFVRTPAVLYRQLTEPGPLTLERISRDQALELAAGIAQGQVVQLDCDDDMDTEPGKLVFSLLCPLSKTAMETPVRSSKCNHWQCFDLKFFLETNQHTSGARWRCGACDPRFVSPSELRICGLTAELIEEFKDEVSPLRNRVELLEDKSYRLLEEKKTRRRGIKRVNSTDGNITETKKNQVQEAIFIE